MGRHQRQHSQSTKPSIHRPKNNKRLTVAVSLICSSPHSPLSSCPLSCHLFNFVTQCRTSIPTCERRWRAAERDGCCKGTWPSAGPMGGEWNKTLKWPPSASHTFKSYFCPGCVAEIRLWSVASMCPITVLNNDKTARNTHAGAGVTHTRTVFKVSGEAHMESLPQEKENFN